MCCIADTHRFPGPGGRQHSTVHIHTYGLFSHSPSPRAVLGSVWENSTRHVWNATKFANSVSLQCVILHKGLFTGSVWPPRWQRWGAATGGKHSGNTTWTEGLVFSSGCCRHHRHLCCIQWRWWGWWRTGLSSAQKLLQEMHLTDICF